MVRKFIVQPKAVTASEDIKAFTTTYIDYLTSWEHDEIGVVVKLVQKAWDKIPIGYIIKIDNVAGTSYEFKKAQDGHMIRSGMKLSYRSTTNKAGHEISYPSYDKEEDYDVPTGHGYEYGNIKNAIKWATQKIQILDYNRNVIDEATRVKNRK